MGVTTSNLTQGPGEFFLGAFGAVEPVSLTVAPESGTWTDVGGTQDGVTMSIEEEFAELEVDQIIDIPERRRTKREVTIETNLAETTLENLAVALNEAAPTEAAEGVQTFEPATDMTAFQPVYKACLFRGPGPGGKTREIIVRKTLSVEGTSFAYKKEDQNVYSMKRSGHYVSKTIKPFSIKDGASA